MQILTVRGTASDSQRLCLGSTAVTRELSRGQVTLRLLFIQGETLNQTLKESLKWLN